MKSIHLSIFILLLCLTSCTNNSKDPILELKVKNPYQLVISHFQWSYSALINTATGDFDLIEEKVYNLLKGKEGLCEVYLVDNNNRLISIGMINIQYVNNAVDWMAWRKRGILSMLERTYQKQMQSAKSVSDSTVIDKSFMSADTILLT